MISFVLHSCLLFHPTSELRSDVERHELALLSEIARTPYDRYFIDQATLMQIIEQQLREYAPIVRRTHNTIETDWIYRFHIEEGRWIPIERTRYVVQFHGDLFWKIIGYNNNDKV